ncbi:MAG TPA: hypothetical protein VGF80_04855 [Galbitalea sp.]
MLILLVVALLALSASFSDTARHSNQVHHTPSGKYLDGVGMRSKDN